MALTEEGAQSKGSNRNSKKTIGKIGQEKWSTITTTKKLHLPKERRSNIYKPIWNDRREPQEEHIVQQRIRVLGNLQREQNNNHDICHFCTVIVFAVFFCVSCMMSTFPSYLASKPCELIGEHFVDSVSPKIQRNKVAVRGANSGKLVFTKNKNEQEKKNRAGETAVCAYRRN